MRRSSMAWVVLLVAGGVLAGVAAGQTPPRIDYRVLAEFSPTPSGPWPHVVENWYSFPGEFSQFPGGGVIWRSSVQTYWIDDEGVVPFLPTGTRIPGLPDEDLQYTFSTTNDYRSKVTGLGEGRSAFQVAYRVVESGVTGSATVMGTPRHPERADPRTLDVSNLGMVRASASPFDLVGPFGGTLEPYVTVGMPIGGVAPAGSVMQRRWNFGPSVFGPEGSISVGGYSQSNALVNGIVKDGVLRALSFGTTTVPGVTIPIPNPYDGTHLHSILPDGSALLTNAVDPNGAWIVYPDGTGRDLITTSDVLPGYDEDVRMRECVPIAASDGRVYVLVTRARSAGGVIQNTALYEVVDDQLRLVVHSDDPRLIGPNGTTVGVMLASGSNLRPGGNWIGREGRIAWMDDRALIFADRRGVVVPAFFGYSASTIPILGQRQIETFGCHRRFPSLLFEPRLSSDMPSSSSRMSSDGSLTFWVQAGFGTFVLSARLNRCPPDVNEDGFVDFFDYGAFVDCFESGQGCGRFNVGDFNQDGFTDFFDYAAFVEAFEVGC